MTRHAVRPATWRATLRHAWRRLIVLGLFLIVAIVGGYGASRNTDLDVAAWSAGTCVDARITAIDRWPWYLPGSRGHPEPMTIVPGRATLTYRVDGVPTSVTTYFGRGEGYLLGGIRNICVDPADPTSYGRIYAMTPDRVWWRYASPLILTFGVAGIVIVLVSLAHTRTNLGTQDERPYRRRRWQVRPQGRPRRRQHREQLSGRLLALGIALIAAGVAAFTCALTLDFDPDGVLDARIVGRGGWALVLSGVVVVLDSLPARKRVSEE
jgi:hypothetical protein